MDCIKNLFTILAELSTVGVFCFTIKLYNDSNETKKQDAQNKTFQAIISMFAIITNNGEILYGFTAINKMSLQYNNIGHDNQKTMVKAFRRFNESAILHAKDIKKNEYLNETVNLIIDLEIEITKNYNSILENNQEYREEFDKLKTTFGKNS